VPSTPCVPFQCCVQLPNRFHFSTEMRQPFSQ
jgi:hypothetical protein